ncbi:hypothetical protein TCAL_07742, partial [Tigriopus californicus]
NSTCNESITTLWGKLCQGRRFTRFVIGSGCGTTREITNHVVSSHPNSIPNTPCSIVSEEVQEFQTKSVVLLASSQESSIPQGKAQEINGGWSVWSEWSTCSNEILIQERTRTCTNPPPSATHLDCVGDAEESTSCQAQSSAPSYHNTDQGYSGNSISEQSATDARRCHIVCQNSNQGCIAWTWKANGMCFHYTDPGQLVSELGSTSGLGVSGCLQKDEQLLGDNLNFVRDIDLAEECQDICLGDNNCFFFTHDTRSRI